MSLSYAMCTSEGDAEYATSVLAASSKAAGCQGSHPAPSQSHSTH